MNNGTVFKQGTLKKYLNIQMNLPFSMKINQRLGFDSSFVTYEGLVKSYDYTDE